MQTVNSHREQPFPGPNQQAPAGRGRSHHKAAIVRLRPSAPQPFMPIPSASEGGARSAPTKCQHPGWCGQLPASVRFGSGECDKNRWPLRAPHWIIPALAANMTGILTADHADLRG